jgi:hypothetical protein
VSEGGLLNGFELEMMNFIYVLVPNELTENIPTQQVSVTQTSMYEGHSLPMQTPSSETPVEKG